MRSIHTPGLATLARTTGLAALIALGAPALAQAQSAIIYGSLSNFDIANDTGKVCHGFEVRVDGLQVADYSGSFTANRYGTPTVAATATGVSVTWGATYGSNGWNTRTLPHTVPWFSGQCYQWVAGTYENGGCEHFGTYFTANPARVSSRWLCESDTNAAVLVPIDPPTATPFPTYYVQPPAVANNPPELVVEVVAPEPAEVVGQYGTAQWIRSFVMQLQRPLTLDELVADNPAGVPMDPAQLEARYSVIQDEPVSGSNSNGNRRMKRNMGSIEPTTRAVVRRIETWSFTGQYNPLTHEALCADLVCNTPAVDEIGEMLAMQMTAANVQPDALFISKVGSGSVDSADRLIACGSKCVQPYNVNTLVTLTAKASSGYTFAGWAGACAGLDATCSVTVNAATNVTATFAAIPKPVSGGGGGGTTTTTYALSVATNNGGIITGSPAGDKTINCGKDCGAKFAAGTVVTLTAVPPAGKAFLGWTDACLAAGTNLTCTVTMNAAKTAKGNFAR